MKTRQQAITYGLTFPHTYVESPFKDPNWELVRVKGSKKAFLWVYEKDGYINLNIKVDPEWREFWREAYDAVIPGYHQNKKYWNTIILDGTIPEKDIKKILFSQEDIVTKTKELGQQLTKDYAGKNPLLVCVLKGAVPFMAELAKHLKSDVKFDFMSVSSYSGVESKTLVVRQDIKEENYYNFKTGIVSTNIKEATYVVDKWNDAILKYNDLSSYLVLYNNNVSIKIRVLLQYYGTNIIRNHFWREAFIRYTMNKAFDIRNSKGQCIIADARFDNDECKAIRDCGGMIIRVDRKSNNDNHDSHESEQITINKDDYVIDNTGTLVGLFYKVLKFVTDYMV